MLSKIHIISAVSVALIIGAVIGGILWKMPHHTVHARSSGAPDNGENAEDSALIRFANDDPDLLLINNYCNSQIKIADAPVTDERIQAGIDTANRFLPTARVSIKKILASNSRNWPISEAELKQAAEQVDAVTQVVLDLNVRDDDAEFSLDNPDEIHIGRSYASALTNPEITLLVLVHELTHAAGENGNFARFFDAVSVHINETLDIDCSDNRAEELSCDFIAEQAVRRYINDYPSNQTTISRIMRAFDYDCAQTPYINEDDEHFGQGASLKCLFHLDPKLRAEFSQVE